MELALVIKMFLSLMGFLAQLIQCFDQKHMTYSSRHCKKPCACCKGEIRWNGLSSVSREVLRTLQDQMSSEKLSTFGNIQQRNYFVGYDLEQRVVSFAPVDCATF
ncbi:unnamed protein product [Prunus armeniaca]|uniref:Peptidase A1 domain-containing protein n=1 Tax=Prunus armeniaca TaxID=36596 RepID=A0A6J5TFT0_PRUAR|nr:unnamed protein product [Prunus armeniaca]